MKRKPSFRFKSKNGQKCVVLVSQNVATSFNISKKSPKFWDWDAKFCPCEFNYQTFKGAICAVNITFRFPGTIKN